MSRASEPRPPASRGKVGSAIAAVAQGRTPRHVRGVLLVLLSGVCWSVSGLLVRLVEAATDWEIVFYRSLAFGAGGLVVVGLRHHGHFVAAFRAIGATGLVASVVLAVVPVGLLLALYHTAVANAFFIFATAPVFAAVLGRVVLKEPVRRATWLAIAAATLGVGVMVGDGFALGGLVGNLWALAAALGFGGFAVAVRRRRRVDMFPTICVAAVLAGLVAAVLAESLSVTLHDLVLCALLGTVSGTLAQFLFTLGARYVPAAELVLLTLAEVVLGPFWVWLGVGEVPTVLTLVGGAMVMAAIVGLAFSGARGLRPPEVVG